MTDGLIEAVYKLLGHIHSVREDISGVFFCCVPSLSALKNAALIILPMVSQASGTFGGSPLPNPRQQYSQEASAPNSGKKNLRPKTYLYLDDPETRTGGTVKPRSPIPPRVLKVG
jgi:hypothetical protein